MDAILSKVCSPETQSAMHQTVGASPNAQSQAGGQRVALAEDAQHLSQKDGNLSVSSIQADACVRTLELHGGWAYSAAVCGSLRQTAGQDTPMQPSTMFQERLSQLPLHRTRRHELWLPCKSPQEAGLWWRVAPGHSRGIVQLCVHRDQGRNMVSFS
jgi:hypothetical protein